MTDTRTKYLISTYRDSPKDQFVLQIINEDYENYYCRRNFELSPYKEPMADDNHIVAIRKSLVGENKIYKFYKPKHHIQLHLF